MSKIIFVIDDEQGILDLVQDVLEDHGYSVHSFSCPDAALSVFS